MAASRLTFRIVALAALSHIACTGPAPAPGGDDDAAPPITVSTTDATQISSDMRSYNCALLGDQELWCWGMLDGSIERRNLSEDGTRWTDFELISDSLHGTHLCALREDGVLFAGPPDGLVRAEGAPRLRMTTLVGSGCAGLTFDHQIYGADGWVRPTDPDGYWRSFEVADYRHFVALDSRGNLMVDEGRVLATEVASYDAGIWNLCAVQFDGDLLCGPLERGELAPIPDDADWERISLRNRGPDPVVMAIRRDGTLWQIEFRNTLVHPVSAFADPTIEQIGDADDWLDATAGANRRCAINAAREVYCSGDNEHGAVLGTQVPDILSPRRVSDVWGQFETEQTVVVAAVNPAPQSWPVGESSEVPEFTREQASSTYPFDTSGTIGCYLDQNGLHCGDMRYGRWRMWSYRDWADVAVHRDFAGAITVCAIHAPDGSLWCGPVDRDQPDWRWEPQPRTVDGALAGVSYDTVLHGLYRDGRLFWPTNGFASSLRWEKVVTSTSHACGIDDDGRLRCWGSGASGQLGLGPDTLRSSLPRLVDGDAQWSDIAVGIETSCGVRRDGTLWCWGSNLDGQAGTGDRSTDRYFEPVRVGERSDWEDVETAGTYACARDRDQSLWCWGGRPLSSLTPESSSDLQRVWFEEPANDPSTSTPWSFQGRLPPEDPSVEPFPPAFSEIVELLNSHCTECHEMEGLGNFHLPYGAEPTTVAEALTKVARLEPAEGLRLIEPGEPTQSAIYVRLTSRSFRMPPFDGPLPEMTRVVRNWIQAGSPGPPPLGQ